jgi:UMF1 family MFS transporter
VASALGGVWKTVKKLPQTPSLFAYLGSSMLYRDALNGMYVFGGIYAAGVLNWTVVDTGIFGILAIIAGAIFAWLGGRMDVKFGPKPVITFCILVLTGVAIGIVFVSRNSVFGIPVGPDSSLPDIAFYFLGALIGAAGGVINRPAAP